MASIFGDATRGDYQGAFQRQAPPLSLQEKTLRLYKIFKYLTLNLFNRYLKSVHKSASML
jgi:hypothetical protein